MAENVLEIPREAWTTVEATDQGRVLDFPIGQRTWMSKIDLQPFTQTPWMWAPYAEIISCHGGWGTLLAGEVDDPKRVALNPGDTVAVEPEEWWRMETAAAGLRVFTFWEGRRAEKRSTTKR